MSDLKQMQFVDNISTRAVKMAEDTYSSARGYTPGVLEGTVTSLEGTVKPYCDKAKGVSSDLLKTVDAKVDSSVQSAFGVYDGTQTRVKEYTKNPRKRFEKAKETTTSTVTEGWTFYKDNGLKGCTSSLVDKLGKTSENLQKTAVATTSSLYTYTVDTADATWAYLNEKPATKPYAAKASELTNLALQYYSKLHDTVVQNSLYAKAFGFSTHLFSKFVTGNSYVMNPANKVHDAVHPYVQYIVDPAVEAAKPVAKAVKDHIKPTPSAQFAAPTDEELVSTAQDKVEDVLPASGALFDS